MSDRRRLTMLGAFSAVEYASARRRPERPRSARAELTREIVSEGARPDLSAHHRGNVSRSPLPSARVRLGHGAALEALEVALGEERELHRLSRRAPIFEALPGLPAGDARRLVDVEVALVVRGEAELVVLIGQVLGPLASALPTPSGLAVVDVGDRDAPARTRRLASWIVLLVRELSPFGDRRQLEQGHVDLTLARSSRLELVTRQRDEREPRRYAESTEVRDHR